MAKKACKEETKEDKTKIKIEVGNLYHLLLPKTTDFEPLGLKTIIVTDVFVEELKVNVAIVVDEIETVWELGKRLNYKFKELNSINAHVCANMIFQIDIRQLGSFVNKIDSNDFKKMSSFGFFPRKLRVNKLLSEHLKQMELSIQTNNWEISKLQEKICLLESDNEITKKECEQVTQLMYFTNLDFGELKSLLELISEDVEVQYKSNVKNSKGKAGKVENGE
jgi:hypothetical protein